MFKCPSVSKHSESLTASTWYRPSKVSFWTTNIGWCSYCWKTANEFFSLLVQHVKSTNKCTANNKISCIHVDNLRRIPFCFVQGCVVGLPVRTNTKHKHFYTLSKIFPLKLWFSLLPSLWHFNVPFIAFSLCYILHF